MVTWFTWLKSGWAIWLPEGRRFRLRSRRWLGWSAVMAALMIFVINGSSQGFDGSAVAQSPSSNSNAPVVRFGFISTASGATIPAGPEGWAIQKGVLTRDLLAAGFSDIQTIAFPNGPDLNEALAAGVLDVGTYGDTPAIVAKGAGLETRAIRQIQVGMNVWLLTPQNGVKSLAELEGQTVATSRGSYMHRFLMGLLEEEGLSDNVTVVHLLPRDAEPALERGDIAAYAAPVGTGPLLVSKGYPIIDEAANHPSLRGTSITVVTEDFLSENPNFPTVWNQSIEEAVQDLKSNADDYYEFLAELTRFPVPVVQASYPIENIPSTPFTTEGIALLTGTKQFLLEQEAIRSDFLLSDWTVNSP